jgi:alanine racemase
MGQDRQNHVTVNVSPAIFARNIRYLRELAQPAKLCVVMKADAYGHGLEALAPVAVHAGADCIGVCTNHEARVVRRQDIHIPLLRLRSALPDEYEESAMSLGLEEQVGSRNVADYLHQLGRRRGRPMPVHIKIDTGMGRSGFLPGEVEGVKHVCSLKGLQVVGIMTHLANADDVHLASTVQQLETFWNLRRALDGYLPDHVLTHTHNSAATIRLGDRRADLVRTGAACFGVRTSRAFENPPELRPVMSMKTRIMEIRSVPPGTPIGYGGLFRTARRTRIATIPVGFGEGYPRSLSNKGIVLIKGQRCPVIGRVSLNITTIDVTDLETDARWGEEVVLVGEQDEESITFEELAEEFQSVHTEINLMAGHLNERSYQD